MTLSGKTGICTKIKGRVEVTPEVEPFQYI